MNKRLTYACLAFFGGHFEFLIRGFASAKSGIKMTKVWDGRENSQILGGFDCSPKIKAESKHRTLWMLGLSAHTQMNIKVVI